MLKKKNTFVTPFFFFIYIYNIDMFVHLFYWFNCTTSYSKLQIVFGKGKERKISFLVQSNPCTYWLYVIICIDLPVSFSVGHTVCEWIVMWHDEMRPSDCLHKPVAGFSCLMLLGCGFFFWRTSDFPPQSNGRDFMYCTLFSSQCFHFEMDPLP